MVFSGATFLFYFLPGAIVAYALVPRAARNALLVLLSTAFYIWGSGALVFVLYTSVFVDYALGFIADRAAQSDNDRLRRQVIAASVIVNLGLLGWFKYAGWLLDSATDLGLYTGEAPDITLPIGISFFTFQSMSYTIDVARGRTRHLGNPIDFALYVTLFPQLIAGPIVRFHEIDAQIRKRSFNIGRVGEGAVRFSHGLAKKVIVADAVAPYADLAFATEDPTFAAAWIGVIAYTLQIYFDFSGYSDMAIGLGTMFGFTFPENFARPYSASSVTDFWRRWHITLSNWFRDYLYIPLGGGRGPASTVYRNLLIVFLLTGLWHGANWTFVCWGIYHGAWLLAERRFGWRGLEPMSVMRTIARRASTLLIVMVGWVLFRAPSLGDAAEMYRAMFSWPGLDPGVLGRLGSVRAEITMALACFVFLLPASFTVGPRLVRVDESPARLLRVATMTMALPVALMLVATGSFSPFLYFQF